MNIALSPDELKKKYYELTKNTIKIVLYDQIMRTNNIDCFFNDTDKIIIFYPAIESNGYILGHYTTLIRDNNCYYFFDSLGYNIDGYKKYTQQEKLYKESVNSLIKLLLKEQLKGYKIDCNLYQIQKRSSSVATCGLHCILRCLFSHLSNDEYKLLLDGVNNKLRLDKGKLRDNLVYYLLN